MAISGRFKIVYPQPTWTHNKSARKQMEKHERIRELAKLTYEQKKIREAAEAALASHAINSDD